MRVFKADAFLLFFSRPATFPFFYPHYPTNPHTSTFLSFLFQVTRRCISSMRRASAERAARSSLCSSSSVHAAAAAASGADEEGEEQEEEAEEEDEGAPAAPALALALASVPNDSSAAAAAAAAVASPTACAAAAAAAGAGPALGFVLWRAAAALASRSSTCWRRERFSSRRNRVSEASERSCSSSRWASERADERAQVKEMCV